MTVFEQPIQHELKCDPEFFEDVFQERKLFESRLDDRTPRFEEGHEVHLREYDRKTKRYTGRSLWAMITYVLRDERFCKPGMCIFAFYIIAKPR